MGIFLFIYLKCHLFINHLLGSNYKPSIMLYFKSMRHSPLHLKSHKSMSISMTK